MTTVLVDMDGVLAWWEKYFINQMQAQHPHVPIFDFGTRTAADAPRLHALYQLPEVQAVLSAPGFYLNLEPVEGAAQALRDMRAAGHDVIICTAPAVNNQTCASEKLVWVERHLGREWVERVVITRDKTRVRGDILIDDKPEVRGVMPPEWVHIIFDQSYNRVNNSRVRMHGWADWRRALQAVYA